MTQGSWQPVVPLPVDDATELDCATLAVEATLEAIALVVDPELDTAWVIEVGPLPVVTGPDVTVAFPAAVEEVETPDPPEPPLPSVVPCAQLAAKTSDVTNSETPAQADSRRDFMLTSNQDDTPEHPTAKASRGEYTRRAGHIDSVSMRRSNRLTSFLDAP